MFPPENPSPCCPQTSQPRICSSSSISDEEVDLCSESDNTPLLPNFSLRDYVSSNRRKGIVNHWPFSSKHLQLCFKHRANDVLPPFQGLDSVEKDHRSSKKGVQTLTLDVEKIESKKENENRSTGPEVESLGDLIESYPSEELPIRTEKMASKVCPVCKTFSSPSNTALNAHIDRCLSGESSLRQIENLKVAKHKMKARKTRSVADIYATSMEWTLEDLDRRNGTNWADDPTQEDADEKGLSFSYANGEDDRDEDDVYVDSNGTKLRILSRFDCLQSKLKREDKHGRDKLVETGNRRELSSSTMERSFVCRPERPKYHLSRPRSFTRTRNGYCLEPHLRKRDRNAVMESHVHHGKKKDLSEQLRKDDPSPDKSYLDPSSIAENRGSSQHNKSPLFGTRMHRDMTITSLDKEFPSLKTTTLSTHKLSRDEGNIFRARVSGGSDASSLLQSDNHRANVSFHNRAASGVKVRVAGEAFTIFGKSMESGFRDASGSNGSKDCVNGYGKCDSGDYVVDVDPIPIPGPPGSFLPSPGHTGSEEIHGDSSLTACKARSSQGEVELIDMNSLDSPISSRSDSKFDKSRIESMSMTLSKSTGGLSSRDSLDYQVLAPPLSSLDKKYELHGSNASIGNATVQVPQSSRPMLRLMGKNLTVVNEDENHPTLKMRAKFGIPDFPPNPPGDGTNFYNIHQAQCFPSYNICQVSQGWNAGATPFKGLDENSS